MPRRPRTLHLAPARLAVGVVLLLTAMLVGLGASAQLVAHAGPGTAGRPAGSGAVQEQPAPEDPVQEVEPGQTPGEPEAPAPTEPEPEPPSPEPEPPSPEPEPPSPEPPTPTPPDPTTTPPDPDDSGSPEPSDPPTSPPTTEPPGPEPVLDVTASPKRQVVGGIIVVSAMVTDGAEDGYLELEVVSGAGTGTRSGPQLDYPCDVPGQAVVVGTYRDGSDTLQDREVLVCDPVVPNERPVVELVPDVDRQRLGAPVVVRGTVLSGATGGTWSFSSTGELPGRPDGNTFTYDCRADEDLTVTGVYRVEDYAESDAVSLSCVGLEVVLTVEPRTQLLAGPVTATATSTGGIGVVSYAFDEDVAAADGDGDATGGDAASVDAGTESSATAATSTVALTCTQVGRLTIMVTAADDGGQTDSDSAAVECLAPLSVSLTPSSARVPVDGSATLIGAVSGGSGSGTWSVGPGSAAGSTVADGAFTVTCSEAGELGLRAVFDDADPVVPPTSTTAGITCVDDFGPTPQVTINPETAMRMVSEGHSVEADVAQGRQDGVLTFAVTGAHELASQDEQSPYRLEYQGVVIGTDQVVATYTYGRDGLSVSDTATVTWQRPPTQVRVEVQRPRGRVGTDLLTTIRTEGFSGSLGLRITSDSGDPLITAEASDRGGGVYTYTYARKRAGTDTIVAVAGTAGSGEVLVSDPVQHVWTDGARHVVLTPDDETSCLGSPFVATATVTDDAGGVSGVTVSFTASAPGQPVVTRNAVTDGLGRATTEYTRSEAVEGETLSASVVGLEAGSPPAEAVVDHVWQDCQGLRLVLLPNATEGLARSAFTVTAQVLDDEGAAAGATIDLRAVMPGAPDRAVTLRADAQGLASFTYSRDAVGTDEISATATVGEREAATSAVHFWRDGAGLQVTLEPAGTTSLTGSEFTATVLVSRDGLAVTGAQVALRAELAGEDTLTHSTSTDADGLASFTFTRQTAGLEIVVAEVQAGDRSGQAAAAHLWKDAEDLRLTLGPAGIASAVGSSFELTATVLDGGQPARGATVTFTASQPGTIEVIGLAQSDDAGRATFAYSRDRVGGEVVTATVVVDARAGAASVFHLWRDGDRVRAQDPEAQLLLSPTDTVPGGGVAATGAGCARFTDVVLEVGGVQAAVVIASVEGTYETPLEVPAELAVDRHVVEATCDTISTQASLDLVSTTSGTGSLDSGVATTSALLLFLTLVGARLLPPEEL